MNEYQFLKMNLDKEIMNSCINDNPSSSEIPYLFLIIQKVLLLQCLRYQISLSERILYLVDYLINQRRVGVPLFVVHQAFNDSGMN